MVQLAPRTAQRLSPARWLSPLKQSPLSLVESLATPHAVDSYLALVNPMLTVRRMRAVVTEVQHPTADSVTLTLKPTRQWKGFEAGQFVQLGVVVDGVRHTRCYSPACSQYRGDGRIVLTIKAHPEGIVSNHLQRHARPGLVLDLGAADGTFTLPQRRPGKVLLVSGGSGITPVLSMLHTLCDEGYTGDVVFLHYAYTANDVPHRDELLALAERHDNVRVVLAYTDQQVGGDLHGFFGKAHLEAVAPWWAGAETFLCGPPGLMRSVRDFYEGAGLAAKLHVEEFAPAPVALPDGEVSGAITFARSGVTAENSGSSLLEQAEAAGLTPEYGCRMGICFSCTAVKKSGCTTNVLTGAVDTDPDREIQLCISVPNGDVALDI
ncbi:MAG: ferredoxin reductase [Jatrophihabitans sp.]|uniref:ferredoxin reductase n=1 Tax=Jatrophihabitans sp. TaxID=1932789 RepID=UPI003F804637